MLNDSLNSFKESYTLTKGCVDWCQENANTIVHNNEVNGLLLLILAAFCLLIYNLLLSKKEKIEIDIGYKPTRFIFIILREFPFWLIAVYIANVLLRWKYGSF